VVRHGRQFRLGAVRAQSAVNVVLGQLLCVPPLGRHTLVAWNVYYVDVRAVWRVSRVVSGILADTVSDEQPTIDRRGLSEIRRSPFHVTGRLCVSSLGRHTLVARNVCYVDVQAVWRVSHVVSGIRADTVSDVQPTVARIGLYKIMHAPHYHRAERLLRRLSGGVAHLPASGLTPFPMSSPMSIDLDCPR
jgi:hypothetical protein